MKHLYLATPVYDQTVSTGYAQSLAMTIAACTRSGITLSGPDFKAGPYVEGNRNWLTHRFLKSSADAILFIDADVTWDEAAVVKLYESGLDVVGGAYPKKEERENYPVKLIDPGTPVLADYVYMPGGEHYRAAQYLPGGFMLARRHVFEQMQAVVTSYPDPHFGDATVHAYFQNLHTQDMGFCGEDVYFCCQWRKLGGTVWLDPDINFGHQGAKEWRGNYARWSPSLVQAPDGTRMVA